MSAAKLVGILFLFCLAIAFVILWPFVVIWALNTLFPALAIQMNFWTWLAVIVMQGAFSAKTQVSKS